MKIAKILKFQYFLFVLEILPVEISLKCQVSLITSANAFYAMKDIIFAFRKPNKQIIWFYLPLQRVWETCWRGWDLCHYSMFQVSEGHHTCHQTTWLPQPQPSYQHLKNRMIFIIWTPYNTWHQLTLIDFSIKISALSISLIVTAWYW